MRNAIVGLALALITGTALAQVPPGTPGVAEQEKRDAETRAAFAKLPDTPGTGPYPAFKQVDPTLPDHVVYRPRDLSKLGKTKLAVLVWGNGGCRDDGASARHHLAQIASHGYLAIAPGKILSGPGAVTVAPRPTDGGVEARQGVATTYRDVLAGIDWAVAENARKGSPYYGKIDTAKVAVAGHSCGGLQAIQAGADPRVKTVIVHNSGVFTDGTNPIKGMTVDKSLLLKLHTPVLYVLGGKLDVAWVNGSDDYKRIGHVPVALLDAPVGHGGTFREVNGGEVAGFAVDWLNWQLRGDKRAAKRFVGAGCGLCQNPKWKLERKGI
jgi:dienelactone hydrolase